jgi:hypothetical protein
MDKTHGQSTPPSSRPAQPALPNQSPPKQQMQPRRRVRHPALCIFFTTIWIVFFLFFLLPWQIYDRPDWSFTHSVKHDFQTYKGVFSSLFTCPNITPGHFVTASLLPDPTLQKTVSKPQHKMSTEQT